MTVSASGQGAGPLDELRRLFPQLARPRPPGSDRGVASGFFISSDGYVVTNNHVVADAQSITVRTSGERRLDARVVGRDPDTDLAVLKVEGKGFAFIDLASGATPRVGDWVVAVGNPFNLGGTATAGIVSALSRPSGSSYVDYVQIDAPINRGNSGGPTFDAQGRLVGVNTAIFSPSGGSVGIGFAIPAPAAARIVRDLIADGKVTRGYIGTTVQNVSSDIAESLSLGEARGALVADVTPGGPADRAGLRSGDLILAMDGQRIASSAELTRRVAAVKPGAELRLRLQRGGRDLDVVVHALERPSAPQVASSGSPGDRLKGLGLAVAPAPDGGLAIGGVEPGSEAARKGVRRGDSLHAVNGRTVRRAEDVLTALAEARGSGRKSVLLRLERGGRNFFVAVTTPSRGG